MYNGVGHHRCKQITMKQLSIFVNADTAMNDKITRHPVINKISEKNIRCRISLHRHKAAYEKKQCYIDVIEARHWTCDQHLIGSTRIARQQPRVSRSHTSMASLHYRNLLIFLTLKSIMDSCGVTCIIRMNPGWWQFLCMQRTKDEVKKKNNSQKCAHCCMEFPEAVLRKMACIWPK